MAYYGLLQNAGMRFTRSVPSGPAYIMRDGMFLDIRSSMKIIDPSEMLPASHPALDAWMIEKGYIGEEELINRVLCASDNAIRVNDGTGLFTRELLIGLPPNQPTDAQFKSLEDWLYSVYQKGGVDVGNDNSTAVFKHYDFSEYVPEEVVEKIKMYYSTGQLRDCEAD